MSSDRSEIRRRFNELLALTRQLSENPELAAQDRTILEDVLGYVQDWVPIPEAELTVFGFRHRVPRRKTVQEELEDRLYEICDRVKKEVLQQLKSERPDVFGRKPSPREYSLDDVKKKLKRGARLDPGERDFLQRAIISSLHSRFAELGEGKYVAVSLEGGILASSDSRLDLLRKVDEIQYPPDRVFLHRIGEKPFIGRV